MKKQADFFSLMKFFADEHKNKEVSPTEIHNFLHEFLKYIFDLNKLDLSEYDISIRTVCLNENNSKRAHDFKDECNSEVRKSKKIKNLTKRTFRSNCANDYFEAVLKAHPTIKNKFDIYINQNACHARNVKEFNLLLYFIQVFGHEVHHIIQYIKHVKEMERYDELQAINEQNLKNVSLYYDPRDARKIKRLIHKHLSAIYANCNLELYADKKGYDYLDIFFNEMLNYLRSSDTDTLTEKEQLELEKLIYFIEDCQTLNQDFYLDRFPYNKMYEKINNNVCKKLEEFGFYGDDLAIN